MQLRVINMALYEANRNIYGRPATLSSNIERTDNEVHHKTRCYNKKRRQKVLHFNMQLLIYVLRFRECAVACNYVIYISCYLHFRRYLRYRPNLQCLIRGQPKQRTA